MPLSGFGIVGKVVFIWLKATDDLNPNVNGDIAAAAPVNTGLWAK